MKILVLNGGSSTFKCWYREMTPAILDGDAPAPDWDLHVDWGRGVDVRQALEPALRSIPGPVDAVGHRIVHGGRFRESAIITDEVRTTIRDLEPLAPEHNRREVAAIEAVDRVLGSGVTQVAVFDTAFHSTLEPAAYVYPGPYDWLEQGIRRYGFHGINHGYVTRQAARMLGRDPAGLRLISCHLGNGASLAAIRGGKSVDTTMGFTPLEGLMMGSRSGSVDPGILIYLQRHAGMNADQLDELLNRKSGLLGISGISSDMREVMDALGRGNERARLAFEIYTHRLVREAGAMLAVLGGADAIVFTGGIGEHFALLRDAVMAQLAFAGPPKMLVIPAQEEWEIARECCRLLMPVMESRTSGHSG